ncbi:MAG: 50S ribosome-binding GTPase, partial [Oscillospiraceae bacterium]|nr:50S ribosome-binding GTPase [Oscillospiraceae bacterium]
MSMNETPVSERPHISFFGCRNAGKSSLLNAVTGQKMAIVSDVKGTTTDPVYKTMELLPAGPVMIIDTPGLDDEGELGMQRVEKALQVLRRTDVAVLVVDSERGLSEQDEIILRQIKERNIRYMIAYNKCDIRRIEANGEQEATVSAVTGEGIDELRAKIAELAKSE